MAEPYASVLCLFEVLRCLVETLDPFVELPLPVAFLHQEKPVVAAPQKILGVLFQFHYFPDSVQGDETELSRFRENSKSPVGAAIQMIVNGCQIPYLSSHLPELLRDAAFQGVQALIGCQIQLPIEIL